MFSVRIKLSALLKRILLGGIVHLFTLLFDILLNYKVDRKINNNRERKVDRKIVKNIVRKVDKEINKNR